jgi:hypothetical protein
VFMLVPLRNRRIKRVNNPPTRIPRHSQKKCVKNNSQKGTNLRPIRTLSLIIQMNWHSKCIKTA